MALGGLVEVSLRPRGAGQAAPIPGVPISRWAELLGAAATHSIDPDPPPLLLHRAIVAERHGTAVALRAVGRTTMAVDFGRAAGSRPLRVRLGRAGRVHQLDPSPPGGPAGPELHDIAALARDVERLFGEPDAIEWAIDESTSAVALLGVGPAAPSTATVDAR